MTDATATRADAIETAIRRAIEGGADDKLAALVGVTQLARLAAGPLPREMWVAATAIYTARAIQIRSDLAERIARA